MSFVRAGVGLSHVTHNASSLHAVSSQTAQSSRPFFTRLDEIQRGRPCYIIFSWNMEDLKLWFFSDADIIRLLSEELPKIGSSKHSEKSLKPDINISWNNWKHIVL